MLSPDIEAEDALALLSTPTRHSAHGVSRRRFLQTAALAGGGAAALGFLPGHEAWATAPIGPSDGVLVLIMLPGGNDGFNMVVPIENSVYYAKRGSIAIQPGAALPLGSGFGLHPNLPTVQNLFSQGQVAIVNGVGYPKYSRSHFDSMDLWMRAWSGAGQPNSGWIGRWLDGIGSVDDVFQAVSFGNSVPMHLRGAKRAATTLSTNASQFGTRNKDYDLRLYAALDQYATGASGYGALGDALADAESNHVKTAQQAAPIYAGTLPDKNLTRQLTLAARLINLNLGLRVITVEIDGFDTHSGQLKQQGNLFASLDAAIQAFWAALDATFATRVAMMTFSEFGRELLANDSGGTDHGTASSMLLIGPQVKGGFVGQFPELGSPDKYGMVGFTTDFHSVYATVLERWLGGDSAQLMGAQFAELPLFKAAPGAVPVPGLGGVPIPSYPPSAPGDFVGTSPYRVVDTRIALGGPAALGPDGVLTLKVAGSGQVPPTDVTAVAMNVTAVDPTADSFVTVFPAGEEMPLASNLNFVAGVTIPNLVIAKLNANGEVAFYNHNGLTHLVVDVVGYFTQKAGARLVPLSPKRIIDTRPSKAPMSADRVLELAVTGVGGVPTDGVGAVLMNVTVTEPSNAGHVTIWPKGEDKPVASSLNFSAGQTIPNLVVVKVGAGGVVNIGTNAAKTHLVADVVGYFTPGQSTSRNIATSPRRVLDTRPDAKPLGAAVTLKLPLVGVGNVPASGVSAVVCNVTVTEPTAAGFITVWPNGEDRPEASSLNFVRGLTIPNLVVCKVGTEGAVCIFNSAGSSHVIVDVVGYFTM